jgi:WD40 repeat protein
MRPSGRARQGVFISYARSDGEAAAKALHDRLAADAPGVPSWLDRNELEGGIGWWNQIEQELERAEFLVLVMTPAAMRSENTRREWRCARQRGVCVYPVKAAVDAELDFAALPGWMARAHFYDLTHEWPKLVAHLRRGCVIARVPFMAPSLPNNFVPREREAATLAEWLLASSSRTPVAITTAISGAGGFGKTTIAAALCHDDRIIEAYEDGILWVTLGQEPNLLNELVKLYAALTGERPSFVDVEDAARELSLKLSSKSCLIVIDDAWQQAHARRFLCGGANCAYLITTRIFDVASQVRSLEVDRMTPEQAIELLQASSNAVEADPERCAALVARLGFWPLAIKLAASAMRRLTDRGDTAANALDYVVRALDKRGITAFDRPGAADRNEAVELTIEVSLGLLSEADRRRCCELAIFREDEAIALHTAALLWSCDEFDAGDFARRLDDLALVDFDQRSATLRLHDTLRAYLAARLDDAAQVHARMLSAWSDSPSITDTAAWRGLAYHMDLAGRRSHMQRLLADPKWLESKLAATDVHSLLDDFDVTGAEGLLATVRDAIRLCAPALASDPQQLRPQLYSRLLGRADTDCVALRESLRAESHGPWLRLLHPSVDAPGGALRMTLVGAHRSVTCLACDQRHELLVSGSADGMLHLWEWDSGRHEILRGVPRMAVRGVALSANGKRALSCGADGLMELWDVERRERMARFAAIERRAARAVAMSADASVAITCSREPELLVWSLDERAVRHTLRGHAEPVSAVAMSCDGAVAVSGSEDGNIMIWNAITGTLERRIVGHGAPVNALAVSPDGAVILSGSVDCSARLWDRAMGTCLHSLRGHDASVTAVALAHGAERALTAASDGSIVLWDLASATVIARLSGHSDSVHAASLDTAGLRAATASADRTLKLWQFDRPGADEPSGTHDGAVEVVAFSPDGQLCATGGADGLIAITAVGSGQVVRTIAAHAAPIRALAFSHDSSCVLSAGLDDKYWQWIIATGVAVWIPVSHATPIDYSAFSPVSRYLATCCQDRTVRLWETPSGAGLGKFSTRRLFDHLITASPRRAQMPQMQDSLDTYLGDEAVFEVAFVRLDRSGRHLILSAQRREASRYSPDDDTWHVVVPQQAFLLVFEIETMGVRTASLPQREAVKAFDVDATGTRVLYANVLNELVALDLAQDACVWRSSGHSDGINAVAIDPAGAYAYSCSRDRSLRVWGMADGRQLASFTTDAALRCLAVSPDGVTVAVGDMAGRSHLMQFSLDAAAHGAPAEA